VRCCRSTALSSTTPSARYDDAVADLTEVIELFPEECDGYLVRGDAHRRAGRVDEALADYECAISRNRPNRAVLLCELGREREALGDYDAALDLDPDHLPTLINRAAMHHARDAGPAARRDVEHGLDLDPDNPQLLCTLGVLDLADGLVEAAAWAFAKAIEREATLPAAWVNRAAAAFDAGDTDAAIADLTQALDLGENATIRYNRALAYQYRERWQQAVEDYSQALLLDHSDAHAILPRRAASYRKLGQLDRAERDLQQHAELLVA